MTRLANISGKDAAKAFEKAGWKVIGQVGSHLVMVKEGVRANLSITSTQGTVRGNPSGTDPVRGHEGGGIPGIGLAAGVFAQGIGFPTVPQGKARIRTIVAATHTREELTRALGIIATVGKRLQIIE